MFLFIKKVVTQVKSLTIYSGSSKNQFLNCWKKCDKILLVLNKYSLRPIQYLHNLEWHGILGEVVV